MKLEFKNLKELHEYYAVHNNCKLKDVATQPVYEIDPPKEGIVLIGEAPGKNEDLQGRPFVGAAGKFLNDLLDHVGLQREDIYVSNVVKYRPPANRDPQEEEKDACRVWLNAELLYIKPRIIVTLGRHALSRFVPDANISSCHGNVFMHKSRIPVFAMFHPAAALYNPNLKETMFKDMEKLVDYLKKLPAIEEKEEAINDLLKL
ncbi:uracil-DNA glycosylase [bacterium]|nr:uracil-DNA glycosylase [bacterium]